MAAGTIEFDGRVFEIVETARWTFKEIRLAKTFGFRGLREVEDGLEELDPDAWAAMLVVSAGRAGVEVTSGDLDDVEFGDLIDKITPAGEEQEEQEEQESVPPTRATRGSGGSRGSRSGSA